MKKVINEKRKIMRIPIRRLLSYIMIISYICCCLTLCGCGGSGSGNTDTAADAVTSNQKRTTRTDFPVPQAPGDVVYGDDTASIDASNVSDGYLCIFYNGSADSAKASLTGPDGNQYLYNLATGKENVFPFSAGDGTYTVSVLEHLSDTSYAVILSCDIEVSLTDEFLPFLYPNQYVQFAADDSVTKLGMELSDLSSDDLDYLTRIYHYVTENITYDTELAQNTPSTYIPNLENTLATRKGICFDYASLMAALLRSQGIPTKLVFGYSGTAYHAWVSVYLDEIGWVDNIIQFDSKNWSLMDPTLAANNDEDFVSDYTGDGSNYTAKYWY